MKPCSFLLLAAGFLFRDATQAQTTTLSLRPSAASEYRIEGSAPASTPHVLQASVNFNLWVDVKEELRGAFNYAFDPSGTSRRFFRLLPVAEPAPEVRVVLIGDSTASDICGWGQGIYGYFKPNATVVNYAYPWTSTRVFLKSEERSKMIAVRPHYVFMQFGYVDANSQDPTQTTTVEQYGANLKNIAETIRSWDGVPILLTIHAPRAWDTNGVVVPAWEDRCNEVRRVAKELQAPLIDLRKTTTEWFNRLGRAGSKFSESECFPDEAWHFSLKGGEFISSLVLNDAPPALGPYLQAKIFDPQPPKP